MSFPQPALRVSEEFYPRRAWTAAPCGARGRAGTATATCAALLSFWLLLPQSRGHLSWRLVCQLLPHIGDVQGFTPPRKSPRTLTVFSYKEPAPPGIAAPALWSAFLSPSVQQDSRFMCTWSGRLFKAKRVCGSSVRGCWGRRALSSSHVGSGSF